MKYKIVFEVLDVSAADPRQVLPKSQLMLEVQPGFELSHTETSASIVASAIKAAVMQDFQVSPTTA